MNATLVQLFLRFAALSIVAVGGANATIPAVHAQSVELTHWLDERTFAQALAVSQIAPGPNVVFVPLIGLHVAGIAGALVALAAFLLPSTLLTMATQRVLAHYRERRAVVALRATLRPIGAGLIVASSIAVVRAGIHTAAFGGFAIGFEALAIVGTVAYLSLRSNANPIAYLAAAAALGGALPV